MPVLRDILARAAPTAALLAALAWSETASAGNVGLPRTPILHRGEACLTRVDRSVDPVVHLDYTIPSVDICLTPDEPADSRTHQFVAFCRDAPPESIPHWLTLADVQANIDSGYFDPAELKPGQVVEDSPYFADCWWPITDAAERRPITCEAARPGVDWDTSALAPGAYVVAGYTYEPVLNDWTPRRGVFRVHDGDLDAAPPAAAIFTTAVDVWYGDPVRLAACVDAMPGSTWRLEYAAMPDEPRLELDWQTLVPVSPVESTEFDIELVLDDVHADVRLHVRLVVEDPEGRTTVAHMSTPGTVLMRKQPGVTGSGGDEPNDFDFCRDNPAADDLPDCGKTSEPESSGQTPDDPGDGCACSHEPGGGLAPLGLLVLVACRRRRD
ncbi:MYXO-CTERM sorting domain-containing protein [Nannocystis pusilla]|uniref:MYXO-CTERM sorting domain-containing protein n=1 Tax=Nannocystis pusilla TaxID=889268 RepID=UPI003DA3D8F6